MILKPKKKVLEASLVVQWLGLHAATARGTGSIPGWERPLEKEMETHPNILAWRMPWTKEPGRLQSMGSQELDTT